jgi:hypothetical protein
MRCRVERRIGPKSTATKTKKLIVWELKRGVSERFSYSYRCVWG